MEIDLLAIKEAIDDILLLMENQNSTDIAFLQSGIRAIEQEASRLDIVVAISWAAFGLAVIAGLWLFRKVGRHER